MQVADAKVLVTGGGTGIGRATASALAAQGARVAISGRRAGVLTETARAIGAIPVVTDVTDEDAVRTLVATVVRELDGYNVLVNNAGVGGRAPLVSITAAEMRRVWETNVLGATLVARESARHFVSRRSGTIVNVGSTSGQRAGPNSSAYASTKYALTGLTEVWRAELRRDNIRVMQVNPSEVITPFFEAAGYGARPANPTKLQPEDIAQVIVSMIELEDRAFITNATVWATNPDS